MLHKPIASLQLLMLAAIAVFSIFIDGCTGDKQTDQEATPVLFGPPSTAFPMPPANASAEMGWVLNDGKRARLADFQGKVLVLDFYATWCEPCRKSIPRLIAFHKTHESNGLETVGLNVGGPDDRIKVSDFARELGIQYPLGFPDKALSDFFMSDNQTIPQTFVFGREGQLLKRFIGYDHATEEELEKVISKAVNGRQ